MNGGKQRIKRLGTKKKRQKGDRQREEQRALGADKMLQCQR